jgi:hypothetical protein
MTLNGLQVAWKRVEINRSRYVVLDCLSIMNFPERSSVHSVQIQRPDDIIQPFCSSFAAVLEISTPNSQEPSLVFDSHPMHPDRARSTT